MGRTPSIPVSVIIFRVIADAAIRGIDQPWSSACRRVSITARSPDSQQELLHPIRRADIDFSLDLHYGAAAARADTQHRTHGSPFRAAWASRPSHVRLASVLPALREPQDQAFVGFEHETLQVDGAMLSSGMSGQLQESRAGGIVA
jgi:hypothetical protein